MTDKKEEILDKRIKNFLARKQTIYQTIGDIKADPIYKVLIKAMQEYAEHYHKEEMNIGLLIKHLQEVLSLIETDPETAIELLITVIDELQLKQTK